MARPPRIVRPGAWYHVTARGIERKAIFLSEADRRHFCELLPAWIERFKTILHAYVLMDNHYHLLVETPEANLSRAMQWLNLSYTAWFNRRRHRSGHLFQGRFKAIVFEPRECALMLSRYVHLNPVRVSALGLDKGARRAQRQGLSGAPEPEIVRERLHRLRDHAWSSYPAYVGWRNAPAWLTREPILSHLGRGQGSREAAYRRYVEEAVREGLRETPWERLVENVALGSARFLRSLQQQWHGDERESPGLRRLRGLPSWERAIQVVEELRGEKWGEFRDRYGDWGRDLAMYLGQRRCGLKLKELGALAGGIDYGSVSGAIRRLESRAQREKIMRKLLQEALRQIENN
jgi:REP element-mobilizing transposase RayT